MRVVIHADASPRIGTGHVIRCLALGARLRETGAEVTLACTELVDRLRNRAEALGITVVPRSSAPRRPDWIVVDGYHLHGRARQALAASEVLRLVIDDRGADLADAAVVVNQNLYASPASHGAPPGVEALAGPGYALLGRDFAAATPERPQPDLGSRVLVTMGGSDPNDATSVAIEALAAAQPSLEARIVIGAAHPRPDETERRARIAGFETVRDAPSLAPHLAWADLVVSACGTSVLEAARLGRPIVGVVLADNQLPVARAISGEGLGVIAGAHPTIRPATIRELVDALRADRRRRARMAAVGPALVDGRGAGRVARVLATGALQLREASRDDADRLLAWRNDPEARRASFDPGPIERTTHLSWLERRLGDAQHRIWIGELAGEAIGVVRFEIEGAAATVSVTLAPARRAAGLGTRLIASGASRLGHEGAVTAIDAWIRPDNTASLAAFRTAGFREVSSGADDRRLLRLSLEPMG